MKTFSSTSIRGIVAGIGAIAVLAAGCGSTAVDLDDAEPAATTPDVAGDPDLDSGDDPDGGVLDSDDAVADQDHDAEDTDDVVATPASKRPAVKPPAAKPAAKPVAKPAAKPVAKPAPKPVAKPVATPAALADGTYEGRLVRLDRRNVTVDLVQVLSGEAAVKAAKEAGVPLDEDGTLPNDVFVKDLGKRVTLPVAGDGGFQIYDCSGGCELVGTTLEALVNGSASPYGGANATFTLRVDHGTVDSLVEIYLP